MIAARSSIKMRLCLPWCEAQEIQKLRLLVLPITRLLIANAAIIDDAEQMSKTARLLRRHPLVWSMFWSRFAALPAEIASWDILLIYCAQGVNRPWLGQKGDEILVFRLRYGIIIKIKRSRVAGQATPRESWRISSCISQSYI